MIRNFLFCFVLSTTAHAAIIKHLNESQTIEVPISQSGLTRMRVKDDRILNVFGVTGEYILEADEGQGQVFIRPTGLGGFKPIHLTLTTEKGITQDLQLTPQNRSPEALILKSDAERSKETKNLISREEIEDLLRASHEDRIPLGYKSLPLNLNTLKGPYLWKRELQGEKLKASTYEVKNNSQSPFTLSEPEFLNHLSLTKKSIVAVWIEKKTLEPGEGTKAHVITKS